MYVCAAHGRKKPKKRSKEMGKQAIRELTEREYREWLRNATQEEIQEDTANVLAEIEIED